MWDILSVGVLLSSSLHLLPFSPLPLLLSPSPSFLVFPLYSIPSFLLFYSSIFFLLVHPLFSDFLVKGFPSL
ncbi:hypothetical protein, partial [Helicobacter pylori]|uniref:hypothetical protein n=1 Tax=Helicobacter pylori TaxID=210 RepID=UPI001C63117C